MEDKNDNLYYDVYDLKGVRLICRFFNFNNISNTNFISSQFDEFQVGVGYQKDENRNVQAHLHGEINRKLKKTSEFIYVLSGSIICNIYGIDKKIICSRILKSKMALLQYTGGHSFKIMKNTRYFEIKQGPYISRELDKREFNDTR
jgi:hypothetical protein